MYSWSNYRMCICIQGKYQKSSSFVPRVGKAPVKHYKSVQGCGWELHKACTASVWGLQICSGGSPGCQRIQRAAECIGYPWLASHPRGTPFSGGKLLLAILTPTLLAMCLSKKREIDYITSLFNCNVLVSISTWCYRSLPLLEGPGKTVC